MPHLTPELICLGIVAVLFAACVSWDNRHHNHVWTKEDE
jgi:hypothetical protein